jgi:acyl-CoA thioesterase-1
MTADPAVYLSALVAEMARHWPGNRAVNIVCHGHSVPAGYFATPYVNTMDAYPHQVLAGIKERFPFAVVNVIVTAIGGENSAQGAERFEAEVLCHRPDLITIDYALNDRGIGLERAEAAWRKMITLAASRAIPLLLLTPTLDQLTQRTGDPAFTLDLANQAQQVRRLADEYNLGLADSYAAFHQYMNAGGHLYDLLSHVNHPNQLGHSLVAREILRYFPAQ